MAKRRQTRIRPNSDSKHGTSTAQLDSLKRHRLIFDALHRGLEAGMTPAASVAVVKDEVPRAISNGIVSDLESGRSVTETLTKRRIGSHFDHCLVSIGETSGRLAETTRFIAERYGRLTKQRQLLREKLRMPLFVGFLAIVVLPLPGFVSGSITPSKYFTTVLISALFFLIAWKIIKRIFSNYSNAANGYPAHPFMGIPFVDGLLSDYSRANFVERLHLLFASGYPIIEAVELSHNSLVGFARRMRYRDIAPDLHQGFSLADTFEHHEILSPAQLPILATGEAAGRLEASLQKIAEESQANVERKIELFVTWFPRAVYAAIALIIASKML